LRDANLAVVRSKVSSNKGIPKCGIVASSHDV
jgi:hypothetical protein